MKALGMVETRGLVCVVEALEALPLLRFPTSASAW